MYRSAIEHLQRWKEKKNRKPLIIEGARQVGKTWLMKEFGRQAFDDVVYVNFDSNTRMSDLFAADLDTERLIRGIELFSGKKIDPQQTLLDGNDIFTEFKGALTEQYVCQQLITRSELGIYYYTNDRGSCEVDFVVDDGTRVIPLEVKATVNLRAKSLKTYCEKYQPDIAVRVSMSDYKKQEGLLNLPLYCL